MQIEEVKKKEEIWRKKCKVVGKIRMMRAEFRLGQDVTIEEILSTRDIAAAQGKQPHLREEMATPKKARWTHKASSTRAIDG